MASLNKVMLIGRLTRDPELRYLPSGTPVADLGIAINRDYTDREGEKRSDTLFVDVAAWAKQAEICDKFLTKGSLVFIEGRLQLDAWETPQGEKRSRLRVVAERVQFLDLRGRGPGTTSRPENHAQDAHAAPTKGHEEGAPSAEEDTAPPQTGDNLPF